jgi:phosphatidylserine/phosphatidylglycerophosphate/cardiolipin synthase-like enzyme
MSYIDDLKAKFFAQAADISMPGEVVPDTQGGNTVTALIEGNAYFGAIKNEIAARLAGGTNRYFYFANWCLGAVDGPGPVTTGQGSSAWTLDPLIAGVSAFELNDGSGGPYDKLFDKLVAMVAAGVDVRIFLWVNPFLVNNKEAASDPKLESYWAVNVLTLMSAIALQEQPGMADRVVLDTLGHTLGAMHLKMCICGDDSGMTAYVGGIDFLSSRYGEWKHTTEKWHDGAVSVQGPSANAIYSHFVSLWNEELKRPIQTFRLQGKSASSRSSATPQLPARTSPALGAPGTQWVQVLRTLPQMNFSTFYNDREPISCLKQIVMRLFLGFKSDPISFAPQGVFEFRIALKKAISAAQNFIYIEDQSFYGIEIMQWINARLLDPSVPNLKVILLYGADPSDPPNTFLPTAIDTLISGVPDVDKRVVFYKRGDGVIIHTKLTIIDDLWCAIGSANCFRRSLYTDGECSVAVLDEYSLAPFASSLRINLWGEHCGLPPDGEDPTHPRDALFLWALALPIWNSAWGAPPPGVALRPELERMLLPFEYADPPGAGQWPGAAPAFSQDLYDLGDGDSRQTF